MISVRNFKLLSAFLIISTLGTSAIYAHDKVVTDKEVVDDRADNKNLPPKSEIETGEEFPDFFGETRSTLHLPKGGKNHSGPVNCSKSTVKCRSKCFYIPNAPRKYIAILDYGSPVIHNNPRRSYFRTNFGGNWASLEETLYERQSDGWFKICFLGKNWHAKKSRAISIEVRY